MCLFAVRMIQKKWLKVLHAVLLYDKNFPVPVCLWCATFLIFCAISLGLSTVMFFYTEKEHIILIKICNLAKKVNKESELLANLYFC